MKTRGFTVLELLVAATITLLLAGLTLAVSSGALDLWRRSQGAFTAATEAGVALDLLERDLQSAHWRPDGNTWFAVTVGNHSSSLTNRGWRTADAVRMKPATADSLRVWPDPDAEGHRNLAEARFGLTGAWLRFIAASAESAVEPALPRAIAYQIVRRPVRGGIASANPAPVRYTFYRSAVSGRNTFNLGYDITSSAYASRGNNPGAQRAPSTIANPGSLDLLANNVIDFGLWLYAKEPGGGLRVIYPAHAGDMEHVGTGFSGAADDQRMPAVVDVMLRVLTEEGALKLEAMESGRVERPAHHESDAAWWWAVAETHSRVFVRRIELKGGGL